MLWMIHIHHISAQEAETLESDIGSLCDLQKETLYKWKRSKQNLKKNGLGRYETHIFAFYEDITEIVKNHILQVWFQFSSKC